MANKMTHLESLWFSAAALLSDTLLTPHGTQKMAKNWGELKVISVIPWLLKPSGLNDCNKRELVQRCGLFAVDLL